MAQADVILTKVYNHLHIQNLTDAEKYGRINDIVLRLQQLNQQSAINVKTTGTISERLCELALRAQVPGYSRITEEWNWMADFSLLGKPFNLLVSVKSFKAKERLLVSGSGNILSPSVGWGLFDDINEWTEDRVRKYLYRGFIGIYMPTNLYGQLSAQSRRVNNINGKRLLRKIENFMRDLDNALENNKINILAF